jgi:hypothetical protein
MLTLTLTLTLTNPFTANSPEFDRLGAFVHCAASPTLVNSGLRG